MTQQLSRNIVVEAAPGHTVVLQCEGDKSDGGPVVAWLVDPRTPKALDGSTAIHGALYVHDATGTLRSTLDLSEGAYSILPAGWDD